MSVYRVLKNLTSDTYPAQTAPTVLFPTAISRVLIENLDASEAIAISFNGIDDHGVLTPGKPSAMLVYENQFVNKLWLRNVNTAQNNDAQVIAEY